MLSKKSIRRMIEAIHKADVVWKSMITLTYPQEFPHSGREAKGDLNRVLNFVRRIRPRGYYFWFCEFQKRGAVHFHILVDFVPEGDDVDRLISIWTQKMSHYRYCPLNDDFSPRYSDNRHGVNCWIEAVKFCRYRIWEMLRDQDGAKKYVTKYALKPYQKKVPIWYKDVGRFWGHSRGMPQKPVTEVIDISEKELRVILSDREGLRDMALYPKILFGVADDFRGVFRSLETGELERAPF